MNQALTNYQDTGAIVALVLDSLTSEHSKRAYGKALTDFLAWHAEQERPPLSKAVVQRYKVKLEGDGLAPSTINLRLSAIRKLAVEAADNGLVDQTLANGIKAVKGVKTAGVRAGNWLTKEQAQTLINAPNVETLKGLRDRAILALLIGCGLRRSEAAGISDGQLFRSIHKGGYVNGESMTAQAVADVVRAYADIAAHDLRRTFAKLAHKGGAGLDQIQLSLGHASIKTTERYLGVEQDLVSAPCDVLGLRI
ncbi:MAG: tyrosine-type recombinase/integrase [Chloroflexi bacterium]|nr:tyrosine-type recombinase/integrase [Chloroflexota bacterium]